MRPYPKPEILRNQKLLDLAEKCPKCMHCGQYRPVAGCHSNSLRHGKGRGIKAHDLTAYMCQECHDLLDGRAGTLTRFEKEVMFLNAAYETTVWLLQNDFLVVAA